jgi:AraC family transcriptional regulator of adaptative response/methylated-DNA-[protein]-cysteine methyltransferase
LPRHENVSFYNLPAGAERAGFRACKQCKPDRPLIRYTITPTSLGLLLIAANKSGICTIEFGESRKALTERLKQEFPEAKIVPTHMELEEAATSVVSMIDGRSQGDNIVVDRSGTAFQKLVWDALTRVPRGETRTYSEIASAIGQPDASRAVALACAANRLAVVIPCHRVIRQDGSLSGYRWGPGRKRALLAREGVSL